MSGSLILDPLVPDWALIALAVLTGATVGLALWRGLSGWWLRALAGLALVIALANPSIQTEQRDMLSDIVIVLVDETASNRISDRPAQTERALAQVTAQLAALPGTEMRLVRLADSGDDAGSDSGTLLMARLTAALAEEPRARVAGMILITDGQVHDIAAAPPLPAPLQVLLTGHAQDWDRRLVVRNAPAFGILGEELKLVLAAEDQGRVPASVPGFARLSVSLNGETAQILTIPVGQDIELPLTLPHGGMNVVQLALEASPGELTDRNNAAVIQINGVRDRLRVLLVSGEPHAGERTWRNLLKSDSSVDLVHFTILRPPEKQDAVPVTELSLIAFPTRELFIDKIDEFDLIIFDRYRTWGILPGSYMENIRRYVEEGGAVLVSAGPEYATVDSLYRTPLGMILPGAPTGTVAERPFLPMVTPEGTRHPVTEGLDAGWQAPAVAGAAPQPGWGRWLRYIQVDPGRSGAEVLMSAEDNPLLALSRVGEGRVALLASDHAWLWARGYEGGGPQLELLRRLAHWMMKEPELEEERLTATARGQDMLITRRTMAEGAREVTVTGPDGIARVLPMVEVSPGRYEARWTGPEMGLYRLADGEREAVIALGPAAPKEFEETIATPALLAPLAAQFRGAVLGIDEGLPAVRRVEAGRPASGRGWIGITPRGAFAMADISVMPLIRPWLFLLIAAALMIGAWLWEGRRRA